MKENGSDDNRNTTATGHKAGDVLRTTSCCARIDSTAILGVCELENPYAPDY
jgi:hypothetical protein